MRGLRPTHAPRCFTEKAPKPPNSTRPPRASAPAISSKIVPFSSLQEASAEQNRPGAKVGAAEAGNDGGPGGGYARRPKMLSGAGMGGSLIPHPYQP